MSSPLSLPIVGRKAFSNSLSFRTFFLVVQSGTPHPSAVPPHANTAILLHNGQSVITLYQKSKGLWQCSPPCPNKKVAPPSRVSSCWSHTATTHHNYRKPCQGYPLSRRLYFLSQWMRDGTQCKDPSSASSLAELQAALSYTPRSSATRSDGMLNEQRAKLPCINLLHMFAIFNRVWAGWQAAFPSAGNFFTVFH